MLFNAKITYNCDLKIAHLFRKMHLCMKKVLYVICLCMPLQSYMLNTLINANFLAICMSFYSGQTKCPHVWTFVLSAIK